MRHVQELLCDLGFETTEQYAHVADVADEHARSSTRKGHRA